MPVDRLTFRRSAFLMLVVGVMALVVISGTSLWLVQRNREFADTLTRTQQARALTSSVRSLLNDAETGQRGFLLADDDDYLGPYNQGKTQLPDQMRRLAQMAGDDPMLRERVDKLSGLVTEKLAELAQTVALTKAGRRDAAMAIFRGGHGRAVMDDARAVLADILARVDGQLGVAAAQTLRSSSYLFLVTLIGGGLILIIVSGALWVVGSYTSELERAEAAVRDANAALEGRVRERTADLQFANAELAQANEEVQRFAYIVSHDLRAPLVNVMGFTAELEISLEPLKKLVAAVERSDPTLLSPEARAAATEDLPEAVAFIRSSTERMDRLINAILRISREGRRSLAPEPVAMGALFAQLAASMQHQLDDLGATVTIDPNLPDIVSDRLALEQVFGNLVDNAIKYLDPARPGRVAVHARQDGNRVVYEVEDNGRGIASADRERIFELFRRAGTQDRPGEGIGLAHVRAMARRLNGAITCESRLGEGSRFRVTLPKILIEMQKEQAA